LSREGLSDERPLRENHLLRCDGANGCRTDGDAIRAAFLRSRAKSHSNEGLAGRPTRTDTADTLSAADGSVWGRDADVAILFEHHRQSIFSYCRRRLDSDEDAEDALQTTFVHALRSFRRGVRPRAEAAWLHAIARNVCRERWRSSNRSAGQRARDVDELAEVLAAHEPDDDELFDLDSALERLAERQREALLLREWRGLSYAEIAQRLDVSEAAVETLLYRARRALAQELEHGRHGTRGLWAPLGVLVGLPRRLWPVGATAKLAVGTAAVSVAVVAGGVLPGVAHHDRAPLRHGAPPVIVEQASTAPPVAPPEPLRPVRRKVIQRNASPVSYSRSIAAEPPAGQPVVTTTPSASRPAPPGIAPPAPAPADAFPPTPAPESPAPAASAAPPPPAPDATEPATSTVAQPVVSLPAPPTTPVTDVLTPVVQTVTQLPATPQLPQSVDLGPVELQTDVPPLPSLTALP
jgi:RNA polymerase sigma-70 factor, ECF subfamily